MTPLVITGMQGLGDNILQRPFVRAAAEEREVFLKTPWPELYDDLPVWPVKAATRLRTQSKNQKASSIQWVDAPELRGQHVQIAYGSATFARGSITDAMEESLPLRGRPFVFDLPPSLGKPIGCADYVLMRPLTVRHEWHNSARNPAPEQLIQVALWLRARGLKVMLVADIDPPYERLVGKLPPHDIAFLKGELNVRELIRLVRHARAVVGAVGWILPAAIACGTPAFILLGGQGGHNAPEKVTDPRMDLTRIGWGMPDEFCRCTNMRHRCDKKNSRLASQFETWANTHLASLPKAA